MDRKNSLRTRNKTNRVYMDLKNILREYALCYLPAKALHRSLAVCKDWKLQISTPFFIHNQSVSFSSVSGFFLQSPTSPPSFISIDRIAYGVPDQELKFLPEPVELKASSNGLLCCQGRTVDKPYYVCNPVNQQWKKLPKPTADHGSDPAIVLVFEPSLLNFVADYKVVCIFASNDIEEAYEFEIYSSLQDSWKVCSEMFFSTIRQLKFTRGIAVNGVVYWHLSSGKTLIFDLKKEKVMDYGYGTYIVGITYASSLGMIDGKLCKSSIQGNLSITLDVLQTVHANTMPMRSRISPWLTKHQVQLNVEDLQCQGNNQLQVLMTWDNVILLRVGTKVFCYDIRTHTTRLCGEAHFNSQYEVFPYVNSLVSLI